MSTVIDIPLNGGQDEGTDRLMLPMDGTKFRLLQNCRLDRHGRIAARPRYTSVTIASASGAHTQLTSYRGRLTALSLRFLAQYIPEASLAADHGTLTAPPPRFSDVQNVWQNASGAAARSFDLACTNEHLCAVQTDDAGVVTVTILTLDGVQLVRTQLSTFTSARVTACGDIFVLVTRNSAGTIAARTFDTTGSGSFTSATTLEATVATGTTHWDLTSIPSSTDYLVTYPRVAAGNIRLRRYTVAHVLVATADVTPTTAIGDLAVAAASTSSIVWAYSDGNTVKLRTLDGSLTTTVGPTTKTSTASIRAPGLCVRGLFTWLVATTATASETYCVLTSTHVTQEQDTSAPNVWGASKPVALDNGLAIGSCQVAGVVSAGSAFSLPFYTSVAYDALYPGDVTGVWDYGVGTPLNILSASDTAGRCSIATDGTHLYAATCVARGLELGGSVPGAMRVVRLARDTQRQCVEAGGLLHLSGGNVMTWDGSVLSTASFPDVPNVISIAQDASGSQTLLATYQYIAIYEFIDATGNAVRSTPSAAFSVTLTGANNRAIPTVSTPRTFKRVGNGVTPRVIIYRNTPGDSVFFRVAESQDLGILDVAVTTAINDGVADATAETREILYTQSQKPVPNVAPGAAKFIAAGRDRLILGGLPDPHQVKLTQLFALGEPPECAHPGLAAFGARLPQPCTGVAASGDAYIAFTRDAIYAIPGAGPQRNGQGEFFAPQTLYADGGCIDWRSIVSCGAGVFFQLEADKLYVLRPGGAAEWVGEPIQDTLATYPVIRGACLCSATQQVVFACTNAAGDAGVLLIYDVVTGLWYTDSILALSVTEYDGKLAYVDVSGALQLENDSAGLSGGTSVTFSVRTGSLRPFGVSGQGGLYEVQLVGTYVGDSTVEAFASYDDGKTWTSLGSIAATSANTALGNNVSGSVLSSGDSVTLSWYPKGAGTVSRVALRFDVTDATDTGALRLHAMTLSVQDTGGAARLPAGNRR